jgi:EmrB/QacA subfamily drug resistance transporter
MSARKDTADARFGILLAASIVCSLIMLDSNVVAVSLPAIAKSLNATFVDIEWVVSAYVLTFSALLMAAGSYADHHGRKRATLIGLAIFTGSSVLCGLATSALMLDLARALQGVGASLLLTAGIAILSHVFTGAERARAFAFWGTCLGIAITSGPIVGGVMTATVGWRWIFLMNLPIGVGVMIASWRILPESADHESTRLDIPGIATFSISLFLLTWALIDGNSLGWGSWSVLWRIGTAALLFAAFVIVELSQQRPMVDLGLFRRRDFLGAAFAMLGYAGGAQVMIFYLPLFLQSSYHMKPAQAGLAMLPFALPMFLTPRLGARLAGHLSTRALLVLGLWLAAAGDLLLHSFARLGAAYSWSALAMTILGTGAGLLNSETTKAMQGAVPPQRSGMASGLSATTRFTGLLLAVAGLGAALSLDASQRFVGLAAGLELDPRHAAVIARRIASGDISETLAGLPADHQSRIVAAAGTAFAGGFAVASLAAGIIAIATGLAALLLIRRSAEMDRRSAEMVVAIGE